MSHLLLIFILIVFTFLGFLVFVLKPGQKVRLFGITIKRREQYEPQAVKENLYWTIPFAIVLILWAIWPLLTGAVKF